MDVLLIEPPPKSQMGNLRTLGSMGTSKTDFTWPPLDLMIISGLLTKHNFSCRIYDANTLRASLNQVRDAIKEASPRCVAFTTSTTTIYHDLKVAEIAKKVSSNITTAAIGTHITALPEEALKNCPDLDIAVYSEPELPLLQLMKCGCDPKSVRGLAYRLNGDAIHRNPPHPICLNLNDFGFPTHEELPLHLYRDPLMKRSPMTITYGTRGCINQCTYCSSPFYTKFRKRTVAHVMEELHGLVARGIKEVRFFDCGITNDHYWCHQLLDSMLRDNLDLSWFCNSRADKLDEEITAKMKRAGCHSVCIGAESASMEILKNVRKNITPDTVERAVKLAKKEGMQVMVYFMLGLPGETRETMKQTVHFAKKLKPDIITLGIATPHPGTEFYDFLTHSGYLKTQDWHRYDPTKQPVYDYPELTGKEIYQAMLNGYRSFYLRPSYIWRRIKTLDSTLGIKNNLSNFTGFMKRYVFHKHVIERCPEPLVNPGKLSEGSKAKQHVIASETKQNDGL